MNPNDLRSWLSSVATELRTHKWVLPVLAILVAAAVVIPIALSKSGKPAPIPPLPAAPILTVPTSATTTTHKTAPAQNYLTGPAHNPFISHTTTTASAATTTSGGGTAAGGSSSSSSSGSSSSGGSSRSSSSSAGSRTTKTATTLPKSCPVGTKTVTYRGEPLCVEKVCPKGTVAAAINGKLACLAPGERCTSAYENGLKTYGYTCVDGVVEPRTKVKTTTGPYKNYEVELSLLQPAASSSATVFHNLARDQLLPTDTDVFGAFLGVRTDRKTAVFVLTDQTSVTGHGRCAPSASHCEFLAIDPGETVTLDVTASDGSAASFILHYDKVTTVLSSGSIVALDNTGAATIKEASNYVSQIRYATYERYTGLLSINLGATMPVTP